MFFYRQRVSSKLQTPWHTWESRPSSRTTRYPCSHQNLILRQNLALTPQALPETTTFFLSLCLPHIKVREVHSGAHGEYNFAVSPQSTGGQHDAVVTIACCPQSTNEPILQMTAGILHLLDEDISACEKRRLGDKTVFTDGEFPA